MLCGGSPRRGVLRPGGHSAGCGGRRVGRGDVPGEHADGRGGM